MAYRDVILSDSPVSYYELETSAGTDSGSGNRTLTPSNVTTGVSGNIGNAWSFNGTNSSASMATFPGSSGVVNMTVEAWVKAPSAQGWSKDYQTFIRRDGTDIILIRGRGSNLGSGDGLVDAFVSGLLFQSTSRVDDGNWHHIVLTVAGNSGKLYVDGVLEKTQTLSKSTHNFGTGPAYVGSTGGTTEFMVGRLDEVAVYTSALNATRVQAHYNAGLPVHAGYTAQPMTANGSMPEPSGWPKTYSAYVTEDTFSSSESQTFNYGSVGYMYAGLSYMAHIKIPTFTVSDPVTSKKIYLTNDSGSAWSGTLKLHTINADWSEGTLTYANRPARTFVRNVAVNLAAGETFNLDLTGLETPFGIGIDATSNFLRIGSSEATNSSVRPYVVAKTTPQADVSVAADAMSASVALPESSVSASTSSSVGSTPMTATAALVDAAVSSEQFIDLTVTAESMDAYATFPTTGGFASPVTTNADAVTASADFLGASVTTQQGPTIAAPPMTAVASWVQPDAVNGAPIEANEAEDDYFQRVWSAMPKSWFRLNDRGSVAEDRMGGPSGTYHGVQTGRFNAPDLRHSVYFDGIASIEQAEPTGTNVDEALYYTDSYPKSTLEFSFRTSKANTFLLVSKDASETDTAQSPSPARELYLRDGKIAYRTHYFADSLGNKRDPYEFKGFKNLADGEWHSVVVKGLTDSFGEKGVEIWVDGKFEIRRTQASGAGELHGFPDWIGSRPSSIDGVEIGALPSSQNFVGEMSEVVFYSKLLSSDAIARHYYDFMGWSPIEAQPIEAFAFMTDDNAGRGNQKRALALYFTEGTDGYSIGGDGFNGKMNFNPFVGFPENFGGYKMFYKSVDDNNGQPYRDPVTDAQTLLSLKADVDIDDYDVIMFKEWPDEGSEIDDLETHFPGARDRLIEELRWANDRGVSLFVTHPRLAVDLGVVDRVEFVPTLKEQSFTGGQGNAMGNYDYGSAVKFPWNIAATAGLESSTVVGSIYNGVPQDFSESFLNNKAFFYEDMNFNNKFRVRAVVEGLTDIPSYMIEDAVYHVDYDAYGWQTSAYKYLNRYGGLQIGDEYLFLGTNIANGEWGSWNYDNYRVGRPLGYFAVPMANVKAGTVVTTFGATHWKNKSQVENPYKDYATTIVLKPGDVLKNKPVGGKIYVNFTEQPSRQSETVAIQLLPADESDFPPNYQPDTAAQREWEWSDTRKSIRSTTLTQTTGVTITMPDGSQTQIQAQANTGNGLSSGRSSNIFPIEHKASWQMNRRGLWWLSEKPEIDPGSVTAVAEPMVAVTENKQPTVTAQRDGGYNAQAMVAITSMPKVAEDQSGDADVLTLPMTARAEFTGFSRVISAEPMTATAEFVENFDMVRATGEQVVLTLHGVDATLYLKEDA